MTAWKLGRVLRNDQGLKKGQLVAVKRNDDLARAFLVDNFVVVQAKSGVVVFYTRKAIPHYVALVNMDIPEDAIARLGHQWPTLRQEVIKAWKQKGLKPVTRPT